MSRAFFQRVRDRIAGGLRRAAEARDEGKALSVASRFGLGRAPALAGPVLVDGTWHNPNYWFRVGLTLGSLGLNGRPSQVVGLAGPRDPGRTASIFSKLGIGRVIRFEEHAGAADSGDELASVLLGATHRVEDILSWRLPFDYPASFFFDNLLKRQRTATIQLDDPLLHGYLAESIRALFAAERIVESENWSMMILSHALSTIDGPLAWIAARKKIPVYVLFETFGLPCYWKVETDNWFDQLSHPGPADLDALSDGQKDALEAQADLYLTLRQKGHSTDLGGRTAYAGGAIAVARDEIQKQFGWNPEKPVVAVFASNFFDFPHSFGMRSFTDFLDWLDATCAVAREVTDVNWLLRGHPVDAWYKGATQRSTSMGDLYERWRAPNIGLAQDHWNGASIQGAVDAIITFHGTIGVEATCRGIPVMVADRGWYHDCGFVNWPATREAYLQALRTRWWVGHPDASEVRRALQFAGMYFCCPDWQANFIMPDETQGSANYRKLTKLAVDAAPTIEREMDELSGWIASGHRYYHLYKMIRAGGYMTSNVR